MKQGILITAYKELDHLKKLIGFFDADFSFFIHIDKKSSLSPGEIEEIINAGKVDFFSRQIDVKWGGITQLKSNLLLAEAAVKNEELEYFHLISGQDFPIKSCPTLKQFLMENNGKEYLENSELPKKAWGGNKGMDRIRYYNFFDLFNGKTSRGEKMIFGSIKAQKLLRISRSFGRDFPKLYGGSSWWTLSRPCLKYVVDYIGNNPSFLKRFNYSFASTEMVFQTIIMNSPFRANVVNNNLRVIDWQFRNGSSPANLDESDYDRLTGSKALFARKFHYPVSRKLIDRLETQIKG